MKTWKIRMYLKDCLVFHGSGIRGRNPGEVIARLILEEKIQNFDEIKIKEEK